MSPNELFTGQVRPDIALKKEDEVIVIELTCCFETNLRKSNAYKKNRYKDIDQKLKTRVAKVTKFYFEVTSLGFIPRSIDSFEKFMKINNLDISRMKKKICEVALRGSYFIYAQRNNILWQNSEILKFY